MDRLPGAWVRLFACWIGCVDFSDQGIYGGDHHAYDSRRLWEYLARLKKCLAKPSHAVRQPAFVSAGCVHTHAPFFPRLFASSLLRTGFKSARAITARFLPDAMPPFFPRFRASLVLRIGSSL